MAAKKNWMGVDIVDGIDCSLNPKSERVQAAQQQFKDDCDINVLMKRYMEGIPLPQIMDLPKSGDFSKVPDFHEAMNIINRAKETFMEVPAELREKFANDPGNFIKFVEDPKNRPELVKMGFIKEELKVPPVAPKPPDGKPAG